MSAPARGIVIVDSSSPPPPPAALPTRWLRLANAALVALLVLQLLWELWLAPLRPGGSWLALKALPLALLWPLLVRGGQRARQVVALVLLLYFTEGVVRAVSESGRHAMVAAMAAALAALAFIALFLADRTEHAARLAAQRDLR